MPSCYTYGGGKDYPRNPTYTGETFTINNEKGEKLFDVVAPNGVWKTYDRSKAKVGQLFQFRYKGPNSGMTDAEIKITYLDSTSPEETLEEAKKVRPFRSLRKVWRTFWIRTIQIICKISISQNRYPMVLEILRGFIAPTIVF